MLGYGQLVYLMFGYKNPPTDEPLQLPLLTPQHRPSYPPGM